MASTTPYPPSHAHASTPLPPSAALAHLSAFLLASETTPWLHPDAQLAADEIKYSTTGGPSGGIVMHNLRRIEQGLRGEVLAPEDAEDELFGPRAGGGGGGDDEDGGAPAAAAGAGRRKGGLKRKAEDEAEAEAEAEGWQDLQQYQLQQVELVGEVGERGTGYAVDEAGEAEAMDVDGHEGPTLSKRDKEARKEEKKRRRKAERRDKEEGKTKG
ncbi:hypothetical protein MBLNU459_g8378t1 [Dothideomycetes sp. NU459]